MGGAPLPEHADLPPQIQQEKTFDPLHFVAPTEFVDLPSQGKGYPANHPLCDKAEVEIRYMTAKDEDILSSQTLLKKGVALERFLQNILVDRRIDAKKLFVADRNAILIAARISGYGNLYETQVVCPVCSTQSEQSFDLNNKKVVYLNLNEDLGIKQTNPGVFTTKMPYSKFNVEFKLLVGEDEIYIANMSTVRRKKKMNETMLSDQYKRMIVSIEGHTDRAVIERYVDAMPTIDSRHLRACYKSTAPNVQIIEDFSCHSCGHEQEMEVPFGADFFWPDR